MITGIPFIPDVQTIIVDENRIKLTDSKGIVSELWPFSLLM
jgi:hypothetical protein